MHEAQKLAYRIDEAVKASGLGRSFLYEKIASGVLKSIKIGKRRLILRDDLLSFLSKAGQAVEGKEDVGANRKPVPKADSGNRADAGQPKQLEFPWRS